MEIYIGALIFSIWYVTLFFGKTIGLSMLLFAVPITLFIINILAKSKKDINTKAKILIIPITLLSATYCIFDNYFFNKLNLFVIPVLIVYMILELLKDKIEFNWNFVGKILEIVLFPLNYIGINFQKLKVHLESYFNIDQKNDSDRKEIIRGLLITIPIVLVILTLLTSADTIFRNLINSILSVFLNVTGLIDVTGTTLRIIVAFCAFVYFMCLFDYITSRYEIEETSETKEVVKKKKDYSIKMVLGVLNIIYLIFCIIQIKSLFIKDININYAEYARQGFFQLMWVSLINLITILLAKKAEKQEGSTYIVSMCLIMILFTFIILVSSAVRMHYYESAYGYTFLRLLVYCILFTETILLIPTVMYVIDFEIELLGGNGADILVLDGLPLDSYIEKGVLEDLNGFYEEIKKDNPLQENIVNSMKRNKGLYQLPVRTKVLCMFGSDEETSAMQSLDSLEAYLEGGGNHTQTVCG